MEVIMKSVGFANKFGSIAKWIEKASNMWRSIDKSLSFINSALTLYTLRSTKIFINQDEYLKMKDVKIRIQ